jgi:prepilin-type N-terminal cleavage/methylation domain-containing protein
MKSKKSFKGMTLVEIIIAMAILAIAGSVMCTAVGVITKMKLTTNALTKRISYEAPIADCKLDSVKTTDDAGADVTIVYAEPATTDIAYVDVTDSEGNVVTDAADGSTKKKQVNSQLTVQDDAGNSYTIDGYLYQATYNGLDYGNDDGMVDTSGHNFKFFVIGGVDAS